MNKIKSFTFYRNYYELTKHLSNEERLQIYDAIFNYMFEDKEPEFKGLLSGIWINFKMPLDTSKINIENGKKGGAPKGNNNAKKQPKNNRKTTEGTTEKQANNISTFYFLLSNFFISNFLFLDKDSKDKLSNKVKEWLKYKWERKEYYKETGFRTLLGRLERHTSQYGVDVVTSLIEDCMANNYKGIIWERLEKTKTKTEKKQTAQEKRFEMYRRLEEEYDNQGN